MESRFQALVPAHQALMSLATRYPHFIGFDDLEPVLDDREPRASTANEDQRRSPMVQEQRRLREEVLLPFLDGFRRLEDYWGYRHDLPYFLCCLSPGRLFEYANSQAFGQRLHAAAITDVLTSRLVHDAYAGLDKVIDSDRGADVRPVQPAQIHQAIFGLFQDVQQSLRGDTVRAEFEQRVRRLADQHVNMAQSAVLSDPGLGRPIRTLTVIVHGTWAADTDWWRDPGGLLPPHIPTDSLWNYLQGVGIPDLVSHPNEFSWSGKNSDKARRLAADQFVTWWHRQGAPRLDVVAHSHGGNVIMRAQAIEPRLLIRNLILLGTPARYECPPRNRQTWRLNNVYSDNDWTQVLGSKGGARGEGRTQSDHVRSVNLYRPEWTSTGGVVNSAGHSDLHEPDFWHAHKLEELLL